jgi:hypothetical protein
MKLITVCLLTLFIAACGTTKEIVESDLAPAAEAEIVAREGANDNTKLNISVKHLAEPNKILENAEQYIVWISPEGSNVVQNVGALKVDDDLSARHETTIPYKNFRVFVTPETSQVASAPTGPVVFDKIIQR